MHEFAEQVVLGIKTALCLTEDRHRDGREALILQEPLMRRRVVGLNERLMALLEFHRCAREGELIIKWLRVLPIGLTFYNI
jgi:hypothetical protein